MKGVRQVSAAVLDPASATVGHLVRLGRTFMPHIDLYEAYNPAYRARCRDTYLYLPEDERFFLNVVRALTNQLPNNKRIVLEQGPFGVGKSLLDIIRGELLGNPDDPGNRAILEQLPRFLREQIEELTRDAAFLVVYLAGAHPRVRERLEQAIIEALERALPPTINLDSQFEQAAEWVANRRAAGSRSSVRIEEFERQLAWSSVPGGAWTIDQLEVGLRRRDPVALEVFRAAVHATIGLDVRLGPATPDEVYEEVRATHVGPGRTFAGMLIFFDEFSQWALAARQEDLNSFQSFVEWVNRSPHVAMVVSSQVRPQLQGAGYNAIETLYGRAYEVAFSRMSYASLIRAALVRTVESYPPVDSRPQWTQLAELHRKLFNDASPEHRVRCYYPFHPATVKALPALADQLGYHERSIAQYLAAGRNEHGFGEFLEGPLFEDDKGTLRLVTLDRLFPYFEPRLRVDQEPVYACYERAIAATNDELDIRLVRTLALCDVLGSAAPIVPTEEGLVCLLNLPASSESKTEVTHRLQRLVDEGLLTTDGEGRYKLSMGGGISLRAVERAINRRKQEMLNAGVPVGSDEAIRLITEAPRIASQLRQVGYTVERRDWPLGSQRVVESNQYLATYKVHRSFEVRLVGWRQLGEWLRQAQASGTPPCEHILVVIATDTDAQPGDLDGVRRISRELTRAGVTVGVPKEPLPVSDAIRDVLAAEQVAQETSYQGSPLAAQALWRRQDQLLSTLASRVNVEAFEWYTPDLQPGEASLTVTSLGSVADRAAMFLGRGLPRGITAEGLVGNRQRQVQTRNDVIDALLCGREIQLTRSAKKPQRDRIIRDALAPIGLVQVTPGPTMGHYDTADVVVPNEATHRDTREIWDILDGALGTGGDGTAIGDVIRRLSQPPYWLPRDLLTYIFAAFVAIRDLRLYRSGQLVPRDTWSHAIKDLWTNGLSYELRPAPRTPLSEDVCSLLRDLWGAIKDALLPASRRWVDLSGATSLTGDRVAALAEDVRAWDAAVGRPARKLGVDLKLTWPSPVRELLAFLSELAEGKLDRDAGDTYATILPEELAGQDRSNLRRLGSQLDEQVRRLKVVIQDAQMLRRADDARSRLSPEEPLAKAWEAFQSNPLDEGSLEKVRAALMALQVTSTPRPLTIGQHGPGWETPGTVGHIASNEVTKTRVADWQKAAATIAGRLFDAVALEGCLGALQSLLNEVQAGANPPMGYVVLTRIANAVEHHAATAPHEVGHP